MAEPFTRTDAIRIAKANAWEVAKGHMRAMVMIEGQCSSHGPADEQHRERYRAAGEAIEAFIKDFEDEGLHE